jgi:hypothetical protein
MTMFLESHECETVSVSRDEMLDTIVLEQPDYDGSKIDTVVLTFDQAKGLIEAINRLLDENNVVSSSDD